jgi:glycosyltransferase involved in cell wall biosynthesis
MRITFVSPPFNLTGGQRVMAVYADRLRRRGHEVLVVGPPHERPSPLSVLKSVVAGYGVPRLWTRWPSHFEDLGIDRRVLDRHRPVTAADLPDADVIVATWWETAEWVASLPPAKGAKAYLIQHHEVVLEHMPVERIEATWRLPMHKIVVARWLADLARDCYGDDDVSLVPNSVDSELFQAPPRGKNRVPTFGTVYSPSRSKGCDIAFEAFERCAREVPGLRLVVFGTAPDSPQFPVPRGAEYHLRPPQADLKRHYMACDAWLFPSRSEGFGLPILEAMACRTPVIGTPVGAAPELLADGAGILVPVDDPEAMARAMLDVVAMTEERWLAMSDAALAVTTRYTWDEATDRFEAALHRAVEKAQVLR